MRYLLIENAIVRCDNIELYKEIDTFNLLSREAKAFCPNDYLPVFEEIKGFIPEDDQATELFVSTHFYLLPCFVSELQSYLGRTVAVMPIRALINDTKLREVYDHHVVETVVNPDGSITIDVKEKDIMQNVAGKVFETYLEDGGISKIVEYNQKMGKKQVRTFENIRLFHVYDDSYESLLTTKKGYSLFSPYASLLFYDEVLPGVITMESLSDKEPVNLSFNYSYQLLVIPENIVFTNHLKTWVIAEKNKPFKVERNINGTSMKIGTLSIPDCCIAETELQVQKLHFGKFFLELKSDVFGQLQAKVLLLNNNNNVYYYMVKF